MKLPSTSIAASIQIWNWEDAFSRVPSGARRILGGWQRSGWLWCCGGSCWWCSQHMTKWISPAGSGRGGEGPMREGYKVVALLLKLSLGLFGLVGWRRVLLPHPGSATWLHQGITTLFSTSRYTLVLTFKPALKMWGGMMWPSLETTPKTVTIARNFFHHPGHIPVIHGNPDLHFEGAGNGPVVITWIGREHKLYSGVSPISLVEHCVTFRHDRRLLSLLGFVHNWPTLDGWQQKKKTGFQ